MVKILLNLVILSLWALAGLVPASADSLSLERPDGSLVWYYFDPPTQTDSYPVAVILQGSECLSVSHKYQDLIDYLNQRGVAVLRVEKPGLSADLPEGSCPPDYLRLNTPQQRVLDLLEVLAQIRRQEPRFNKNLALLGGSEGAMVAALAAPLCTDLKGVVLLSGGGGGTFGQEVLNSVQNFMVESGATESEIRARLQSMRQQMEEIRREPVWSKEWLSDGELSRNTYLWWAAAWDLQLKIPLMRVTHPVLAWQGESDRSVRPESGYALAEAMRVSGKNNFEFRTYPGEHAPPPEVLTASLDWILRRFALQS